MKFNRIGRILVCLVLICALVVNISPIKAEADVLGGVIATGSLVGVPVGFWVVAALVTLGVIVDHVNDVDFSQYNSLVNDVTIFLSDAGTYVKDGMVDMIRAVDETGKAVFYTAGDSLEAVRGFLTDSGSIISTKPVPADSPIRLGTSSYSANKDVCPLVVHANVSGTSAKYFYIFVSNSKFNVTFEDGSKDSCSSTVWNGAYRYYLSVVQFSPTVSDVNRALDKTSSTYASVNALGAAVARWWVDNADSFVTDIRG